LRIYTPVGKQPYPVLIFFHGGGFVVGTLDEFDPFCTFMAAGASCVVASIDYRLAPEHKHPAAVEDAVTAMNWVTAHAQGFRCDPTRIAVAGDSAGGNLATVVSIIARNQGFPRLKFQVLICPWVDSSSFETNSFRYFGDGLWLPKANMDWYRSHYLQNQEQAIHPFVSPLLEDDLRGLPSALVITAEFDVLRDQGEAYAHRLEETGISVQCTRYRGVLHDFVIFPGLFDQAKAAIDEICTALQRAYK
jgi:acetyl esterase